MIKGIKNKQRRNPTETRTRILKEATKLFAVSGFAGNPISEIIRAAKVNKRMIYHYFGDKKGLYRAVFLQQWGELKEWFDRAFRRRLEESGGRPPNSRELMSEALGIFFDFMASHRDFVRLMMWEGLEGGEVSRSLWADVRGPLYVQIEFLAKQAQEEGFLDRNLDPAHLIVSFLGVISFYFAYAPTLFDILHKDPFDPAALAERKRQVLKLLEGLYKG
jgi:TetR/AcrR family transcriptional regulator